MTLLKNVTFVCIDCETTGLDILNHEIIEFAAAKFTIEGGITEHLNFFIKPKSKISKDSQKIHNITDEMVENAAPLLENFQKIMDFINGYPIVGHMISFDIDILQSNARRLGLMGININNILIDTLRLAKYSSQNSESYSLSGLCKHFGIQQRRAHRALDDVIMTIELFKTLSVNFKNIEDIQKVLSRPILMLYMPIGHFKGKKFSQIPSKHLQYIKNLKKIDNDLKFTINKELNKRSLKSFNEWNPFKNLL